MLLSETSKLMESDSWTDRLAAEYCQLMIRIRGLKTVFETNNFRQIDEETTREQLDAMTKYSNILWRRICDLGLYYKYEQLFRKVFIMQ